MPRRVALALLLVLILGLMAMAGASAGDPEDEAQLAPEPSVEPASQPTLQPTAQPTPMAGGTSPEDALPLTCDGPISGRLDRGGRLWARFSPFAHGRTLAVLMHYAPSAREGQSAAPQFNIWVYGKGPMGVNFQIIGRGTPQPSETPLKGWRGGGNLENAHFVEILASPEEPLEYKISLNCRWPMWPTGKPRSREPLKSD